VNPITCSIEVKSNNARHYANPSVFVKSRYHDHQSSRALLLRDGRKGVKDPLPVTPFHAVTDECQGMTGFFDQDDVANGDVYPKLFHPFLGQNFLKGQILFHSASGQRKNLFPAIDVLHAQDFTGLFINGRNANFHE